LVCHVLKVYEGIAHNENGRSVLNSGYLLIRYPGAYPGIGAEERGQSEAIAETCLKWPAENAIICTIMGRWFGWCFGRLVLATV